MKRQKKTPLYKLNLDELLRGVTSFDANQRTITFNNNELQSDDFFQQIWFMDFVFELGRIS